MIYRHEIKAFNEFWLDCDTEMLFSILVSKDEKYRILAYRNDYYYTYLGAYTPSRVYFEEMRSMPDIADLREKVFHYIDKRRGKDVSENIEYIKTYLKEGYYVLAGVDLYEWVEENMCYHNHHVEHYALLNGYDDEKNVFYTMETDNEKYREFQVGEQKLSEAMELAETLQFQVVAFCIKDELSNQPLYTWKELRKNAKRIVHSIRPLLSKSFWLFTPKDYQNLFYRDMTVMYLMQINCRMKANCLLFAYLEEKEGLDGEFKEKAEQLENGWIDVRRTISKLYFKNDANARMQEQNEKINGLLREEREMWKKFISDAKQQRRQI
ncbi:MAG: hypothetical protein J6I65_04275 [Lachnospiraceae bacterium]|nr:hypothetical protein [Lachnospiraceae bacterium]